MGRYGYLLNRSRLGIEIVAMHYAMTRSLHNPRTSANETIDEWTGDYGWNKVKRMMKRMELSVALGSC